MGVWPKGASLYYYIPFVLYGIMRQGEESLCCCVWENLSLLNFSWVLMMCGFVAVGLWYVTIDGNKIRTGEPAQHSFIVLHTASSCLNNHVHLLIARNLCWEKVNFDWTIGLSFGWWSQVNLIHDRSFIRRCCRPMEICRISFLSFF